MKLKTIKLSDGHAPTDMAKYTTMASWDAATRFRVEQITDSVEYRTGQFLERAEVEKLCASTEWKVTIVPIK